MDITSTIALTMGVAWASGINLYAAIFMLGYLGSTGAIVLPSGLEVLTSPLVLGASGFMYCVEFFADKVPGVDTSWDILHTFIRIPAGAILAMQTVGDVHPAAELAALLIGGSLAAGSHAIKAGSRVMINTSPEPFSNWLASIGEDVLVIGGLWTALHNPWLFLIGLVVFILLATWLLPRIWCGIKRLFQTIRRWFGFKPSPESPPDKQP